MSKLKITNITNQNNDGGAVISGVSTFSATDALKVPVGTTGERVGIESGSLRYNSTDNTLEFYNGTSWLTISSTDRGTNARGVFGGGYTPTLSNVIDYVTIATTGNATDFGDLTLTRWGLSACSSSTRGIFGGGYLAPTMRNVIDYITIATTGDATDFGDLTITRGGLAACSSSTRGVFGGGYTPSNSNVIDYITIASIGNATDFGDLTQARYWLASCSSSTRGVFGGGGVSGVPVNTIDYITIATTGDATDFGDLSLIRFNFSGCSSSTRGVFGGGFNPSPLGAATNTIDYITIASVGNATDFGDLTIAREYPAACSSSTRGVFGGGRVSPANQNVIDYITIATIGNATDFGDLTTIRNRLAACSNGHGGLS